MAAVALASVLVFLVSVGSREAATQGFGANGALAIAEHTEDRFAGSLPGEGARPTVTFDSRTREVGRPPGTPETTGDQRAEMVDTRVEVGDLSVDSRRDLQAQTLTFGAGGERITAQQKRALTELCGELESALGALGTVLP